MLNGCSVPWNRVSRSPLPEPELEKPEKCQLLGFKTLCFNRRRSLGAKLQSLSRSTPPWARPFIDVFIVHADGLCSNDSAADGPY